MNLTADNIVKNLIVDYYFIATDSMSLFYTKNTYHN